MRVYACICVYMSVACKYVYISVYACKYVYMSVYARI